MRFVIAVSLLAACGPTRPPHSRANGSFTWVEDNGWRVDSPTVIHDDARGVTCWMAYNGISCLPDKELSK